MDTKTATFLYLCSNVAHRVIFYIFFLSKSNFLKPRQYIFRVFYALQDKTVVLVVNNCFQYSIGPSALHTSSKE